MRFKLVSCEILYREMCAAAAGSPHQVDVEFLPAGLHQTGGSPIRKRLQETIDRTDAEKYDAILLGYALCAGGTSGLAARTLPLVLPRAHDCIALLMGGSERCQTYLEQNRGVLFRSTGWLERGAGLEQDSLRVVRNRTHPGRFDELNAYQQAWRRLTYIATGLEPDDSFERAARAEASRAGMEFERLPGDLDRFERLLAGDWDEEDFLIVPPGWRITATYGAGLLDKEPS